MRASVLREGRMVYRDDVGRRSTARLCPMSTAGSSTAVVQRIGCLYADHLLGQSSAAPVLVCSTALVVAALAACDSTPASPAAGRRTHRRQVTVVGNGQGAGHPRHADRQRGDQLVAADVTTALNQTNERQQAVDRRAGERGHRPQGHRHHQVTLQPQYGSDGTRITGYQASNAIDVKIRDARRARRGVLALIVSTGGDATRINSVNLLDRRRLAVGARTPAPGPSRTPRTAPSSTPNCPACNLGKVISISEAGHGTTPPVADADAARAMAEAAVPLSSPASRPSASR